MNKFFKQIIILIVLVAILILPYFVFAESPLDKLKNVGPQGGYADTTDSTSISTFAGTAVKGFLGILGVIFIILIIYAGYIWMIAEGNEERITKAKQTIWRAMIGLFIIIGAYAIWNIIWYSLLN